LKKTFRRSKIGSIPASDEEKRDIKNHGVYLRSDFDLSYDFAGSEDEEFYDNSKKNI